MNVYRLDCEGDVAWAMARTYDEAIRLWRPQGDLLSGAEPEHVTLMAKDVLLPPEFEKLTGADE